LATLIERSKLTLITIDEWLLPMPLDGEDQWRVTLHCSPVTRGLDNRLRHESEVLDKDDSPERRPRRATDSRAALI